MSFNLTRRGKAPWPRPAQFIMHLAARVPCLGAQVNSTLGSAEPPQCYYPPMIDWSSCVAVERDPARVSGAWVFRGTRVPVAALFENLEDDATLHEFLEWFPGVTAEQARAVLEHAARSALEAA